MSLDYSQYNGNRVQGIFQSRRKIISHLLLHGSATRRELAEELQVTFPAVATHVNELLESEVIESSGSIQQGKNRRTQEFVLSIPDELCGGVSLTARGAELFLLKFDGSIAERRFFAAKEPTQASVIAALRLALSATEALQLGSILIVIDGLLSAGQGVVFSVHGVSDWDACSLISLCGDAKAESVMLCTTRSRALVRGYGQELKTLHRIGVFELRGYRLRLSSYVHGFCDMGQIGTESGKLHIHASGGKPCFCGKEDCFLAGIHAGNTSPDYVMKGIEQLSNSLELNHKGLVIAECSDVNQWDGLVLPHADMLYEKGIAYLAAEQAWVQTLRRLYAPAFTLKDVMKEYTSLL